jgi:hypothetical protein
MSIGINILRPAQYEATCERFEIKGRGIVYAGRNPRTFERNTGDSGMRERPWVIRHPDCEDRYYKAIGIESFALFTIREGAPIGVMVREWDESIDGPIEIE